ncbi:MAG: beta-propeller domain-containing protein, partial [Deltaproteobacteria bacterium]|nr:beta-propeller domain-containing protein [Deltaproteobacteria bacterium]
THIHKFEFDPGSGFAHYVASGTVIGYALNQFSFDERDSVLRVATTLPDWGWWDDDEDQSESFVSTLVQEGDTLEIIGQVGGLGMGETIQSVRFIGEQGYVVTFRQTDPLYVVDLSDPTSPEVTGELKVPGFSSYIHPLDDDHLLTIGRDGTEDGEVLGLSFQIFDVSDPADPVQVAKTTLPEDQNGYSWSEAQWDHHAFVYFAHLGLLAIPVSGYNWSWDEGNNWGSYVDAFFSRLDLYHVSVADGIEPVGSVSHASMMPEFTVPDPEENTYCWTNWSYTDLTQIRRGVFLENFLCSVSRAGVQVHDTVDLVAGPVSEVAFEDPATLQQTYGDLFECYSYEE